jgi:acyl carrier protein
MTQMTQLRQAGASTVAQVMSIIAAQAMIEESQITPNTALADLALDSLVMVEIVFALEESFGVSIPFNANTMGDAAEAGFDMSTPAAIAAAIESLAAS